MPGLVFDPQGMVAFDGHLVVDIGLKADDLVAAFPFDMHADRDEWRIVDRDAAFLDRGDEIIFAVLVMPQNRCERA